MEYLHIEDLKNNIKNYKDLKITKIKPIRNIILKNKEKITEKKKQTYIKLKQKCNFSEIQRQRAKDYYKNNKEVIRKKNLDRYHHTKVKLEFPEILFKTFKTFIIF